MRTAWRFIENRVMYRNGFTMKPIKLKLQGSTPAWITFKGLGGV